MKQLSEFETLQGAREWATYSTVMLTGNMVAALVAEYSLLDLVESLTDQKGRIFNKLMSDPKSEFNFDPTHFIGAANIKYMDDLAGGSIAGQESVPAELSGAVLALKDLLITLSIVVLYPYENATQAAWNRSKGIYTEKEVANWAGRKNIKITLNQDLPEQCSATAWDKDNGFELESLGRSVLLRKAGSYKIKLKDISVDGVPVVRIPFPDVDFDVEAI